ncbi:MAG: hypothetical protein GPJ07_04710 [Microcystis aeruginosa G13-07]|jgi:hypothetical protein|nr:hypothetical protein [Microcystis aeruginosa G13-07]
MDESELAKIPVILTREASQERYQIGSIPHLSEKVSQCYLTSAVALASLPNTSTNRTAITRFPNP